VANLVDADCLVLLTDTAGLYTADPRADPSATLIDEVPVISDQVERLAAGAGTTRGTGGMATKVQAARLATESGVTVLIADGRADNVLIRAAAGEPVGTRFPAVRSGLESPCGFTVSLTTRMRSGRCGGSVAAVAE
jgi:glutamate 5-kinase